jgi:hypothetical protein
VDRPTSIFAAAYPALWEAVTASVLLYTGSEQQSGVFLKETRLSRVDVNSPQLLLYPPAIRAPAADTLLNLLAIQILLHRLLRQLHNFTVARKAQRNQLVFRQSIEL